MKKLLNSINLLVADYLSGKDMAIIPKSELTLFIKQCEDDLSSLKYEVQNITIDGDGVNRMIQDEVMNALDFRSGDLAQYIEGCGSCDDIVLDLKSRIDKFKTKNSLHENTNK
tara:strand:- start:640 stop:978 length:339 start_codon:yes stop_codon:yes gene_type:complete